MLFLALVLDCKPFWFPIEISCSHLYVFVVLAHTPPTPYVGGHFWVTLVPLLHRSGCRDNTLRPAPAGKTIQRVISLTPGARVARIDLDNDYDDEDAVTNSRIIDFRWSDAEKVCICMLM